MIHIIGGGLQGMSIAFLLQKENIQSIVYDRNDKGQASAASAGIIVPWVSERRNKPWLKLVTGGAKYYPEFIKSLNAHTTLSTNYENNGAVILFDDDNKLAKAHKRIKDKMELYPEIGELINDISKHDALTHDHTGLYISGGSQVTGEELLKALKDAYINLGGIIKNKSFKDKDRNDVDTYIFTTGAWGIEQSFEPKVSHQRAEIYHFKTLNTEFEHLPVVMHRSHYIVNTGKNKFAIGTTHIDTESFDVTPNTENYQYLKSLVREYFGDIEYEDIEMRVGLRPYTRDFLPYIGQPDKNTYAINGLGSSGLTAAPYIAKEIVTHIKTGTCDINFSEYDY